MTVSDIDQSANVRRVSVAGLAAFETGPPEGEPVVMLPGYTGSKEDFAAVLPILAAAGFRAVAVDQRGQFESSPDPSDDHEHRATRYSVAALAADVHRVVEELGGPVHLVGHSFGGLVARASVIAAPEDAASLTLLCSGPAGIVGPRRVALRAMHLVYDRGGRDAVWQAIQAADTEIRTPEQEAFQARRFFGSSELALRVVGAALLDEPDRVADLAAATSGHGVPVMVAHGVGDDAWPPALQAEMARRLGARYETIPAALHSPAAQNPEATAAVLISFLQEASTARAA